MLIPASTPPRLLTLILLTALSVASLNMFLPSLNHMAQDFGVDYAVMNLSISAYLVVTALLQLIVGPLSDRYGRRPVILGALLVFSLASVGCSLAQDAWVFLAFRMAQGAVTTALVLPRASVRDLWSTDQAAGILGFIAMAMSLGPMIGPVLGGFVDQWLGWRANFVVFVGLGLAMLWISWADYGETNSEPSETMLKQFRGYPELLRSRRFWAYSLCLMFSIGAFYAYLGAAPMVAQATFGLSAGQVGIAMGTVSAGFMLGNFLSGRYSARVGVVGMMIAGRVAAVAGLAMTLAIFLAGYGNVLILFGGVTFIGLGNGLTLPSANAGVMSVRPRLAGSASGFSGALTVAGGAFWSWATAALLTPENGPRMLLAMALATSALGLAAALWLKRLERLADVSPERAG